MTCFDGKMGEGLVLGVDDTTPELVLSRILFMASFIWWNKKAQNTSSLVLYNCHGPVIPLTQKIALGGFHPKRAKEWLLKIPKSQRFECPNDQNSAVKTTVKNYLKKSIMRGWFCKMFYNNWAISQALISRELGSIREQTFSEITSLRLVVAHEFLTSFLVGWNKKLSSIS